MCKWNKWGDTRIDPCMREYVKMINKILKKVYEVKACCCGHGKYPKITNKEIVEMLAELKNAVDDLSEQLNNLEIGMGD